ncbi:FAD-dependent oxidoreductase, partial [Mycobacterium avium]
MVGDARPLRVLVVGAGVAGISVARGLLRDGHDVTVFESRPRLAAAGGAVTVWSNGETVLRQLGVEMDGAGRQLSSVRAVTSTGRPLATLDVTAMARRLGAPVRMVPRRVLLERLLDGFPPGRIHCDRRAVALATSRDGVSVEFTDGTVAEGDVLIGADGLHSMVREWVGARHAKATGWCSWQGLVSLPEIAESDAALMMIGGGGNLGLWPAGGADDGAAPPAQRAQHRDDRAALGDRHRHRGVDQERADHQRHRRAEQRHVIHQPDAVAGAGRPRAGRRHDRPPAHGGADR